MNDMILKEKKQEINREFEIYLQLQKGLQEMQPAQENLQNLFEIEDLLERSEDEQLINTIYLHLSKQFHHFNQNVQYQIYLVFERTAESKFGKVFNKKEVLDMFHDHIRSLDQMTRTIAIKILGVLTPFYLDSIQTFHLINNILLNSDYHQEIKSCIHVLGNFVEGSRTPDHQQDASSNQSALRLLVKGDQILAKCGEGVYLNLLNRVKLNNKIIQINYYKQIIALICANSNSSLRRKLKLIIRVCHSNHELATDFFQFCEENFDQFIQEDPQFINKHITQSLALNGDGNQSLSQTLLKLSAKSKNLGQYSQNSNFNQKLKNVGKSLNQILEKKVKPAGIDKIQSSVIEAIVLIQKQSRHFDVNPSFVLNEKIIKSINKWNISVVRDYMLSLNITQFADNNSITSKSILINIHNLIRSDERRRCLNLLEIDEYDTKYVEKNFQILAQVSTSLTSPNDSNLLFRSFSNTFHKLSFQIISKNHENIKDFHEKHFAKFTCLLAFLSPLRSLQIYQTSIISLLKERIFKIYLPLFRLSGSCPFYSQFFNIVNLTLCQLYNKLLDKNEVKALIKSEFIMNISSPQILNSLNKNQLKILKRVASQFAVYNIYESAYSILSILKQFNYKMEMTQLKNMKEGDECGKEQEERQEFQLKLINLFLQFNNIPSEQSLLKLYDILLLFSNESKHTFETAFMQLFCNYYQYILYFINIQDIKSKTTTNDGNMSITDLQFTIHQQIRKLHSHQFNLDKTTKATIRFIQKLMTCINLYVDSQNNSESTKMEEENTEQQLREQFKLNLADPTSRISIINEEDEDEGIYDENGDDNEVRLNPQLDFFIDGRQNIVERILSKPKDIIKILLETPLVLPRSLFIYKRQPILDIIIHPLTDYTIRAEKGSFLQGYIRLQNVSDKIKSKIHMKVDLNEDVLPLESIKKNISRKVSIINNSPAPKIFSENASNQNFRFIPFSTLVLFPYIGQFNVTISIDLMCSNTGEIILTSFSQLVQINAI